MEYVEGSNKTKATLHTRIKKDSLIWMSIQSTIEAFRILINRDSVFIIDRLSKKYSASSYVDLQKKMGFALDYDFFESIITANLPDKILTEGKRIKQDDLTYIVRKDGYYQFEYFISSSLKHLEMIRVTEIPSNNSLEIDYNTYVQQGNSIFPNDISAKMTYITPQKFTSSDVSINHNSFEILSKSDELSFPFTIPDKYVRN